jgi:hypothetical protein
VPNPTPVAMERMIDAFISNTVKPDVLVVMPLKDAGEVVSSISSGDY